MKLQEFIQNKIMPVVNKMQSNMYVSSLTEGMMKLMPVMLGVSIISLIYLFPVPAWTDFIKSIGLYDLLQGALMCANILSVFFCLAIGYSLGGKKKVNPFSTMLISLFCFLILIPGIIETGENGVQTTLINVNSLGGEAMITAIIVSMLATTIFAYLVKKNLTIKFPDSVPSFVSDNFAMIPPSLITIGVFVVIRGIFTFTPYGNMTAFIYSILQAPLSGLGNTLGGHIVLMLVASLLWWCGIHGTTVIMPIMTMVLLPGFIENMTAVMSGMPAPYELSYVTFFVIYTCLGGTGCIIGLAVDMALFTKSQRYKVQGRLSLIPSIFNISEPLMYGLPVCFNPIVFIPWVFLPVGIYLLLYGCIHFGLFATPSILTGVYVLPGFITGFLSGGGLGFGIFCVVAMIISCIAYYPFVKIMDKQALLEESQELQEEETVNAIS